MKKAKALILFTGLGSLSAAAIVPVVILTNQFSNTFKSDQSNADNNSNETDQVFDENLKDANQGFENIAVLNLKSDLGSLKNLSEQGIKDKLMEINPQLGDKKIYIKALTLKKVKYTVENYTGIANANFQITSLESLISDKDLGKIRDVKSTTIIEKIKERNPILSIVSFENEVKFLITSLNSITMIFEENNVSRQSESIELKYNCISIGGLFWNNELGPIENISEEFISERIRSLNSHLEFLTDKSYNFKFVDSTNQTATNVRVNLFFENNLINFDEVSFMDVKYNVNSIEKIIQNYNLGEIDDVSDSTILRRVAELNPIFKNSSFENSVFFRNKGLTSSSFEVENLSGRVTVTYSIRNLTGLLLKEDILDVDKYSEIESERNLKIIETLKNSNEILKELSNSAFQVTISKNRDPFTVTDEYITGNSFTLKLNGYSGEQTIKFRIKRQNISNFLTSTDMGSIYWVKPEDVIQIIKDKNGANFNENEIIFSTPTYTGVKVTAKPDSLNYFGETQLNYSTRFTKTTGFDFANPVGGEVSTDLFMAEQKVEYSSTGIVQNTSSNDSSIEIKYAIPNGYTNLVEEGYKNFKANINIVPDSVYANSKIPSGELQDALLSVDFEKPLNQITNSWSAVQEIGQTTFQLNFRTRTWFGTCGSSINKINFSTKSNYQLIRSSSDGIDYFTVKINLKTTMNDYSTCDTAVGKYAIHVQKMDIN